MDQAEVWNGPGGRRWVALQPQLDKVAAPVRDAALTRAAPRPGERVVDVGCGAGVTVLALAERVGPTGHVLGVDLSAPMAERARERVAEAGVNAEIVVADAASYAFAGDRDLLFSAFGVMFFPEPERAFGNLARALRPGGRLVFACWRPREDNTFMELPFDAAAPFVELPARTPAGEPGPYGLADPDRTRALLTSAGLRDVAIDPLDEALAVGATLDDAADFATMVGPVVRALEDASEDARERAKAAIRDALAPYAGPDGVRVPSAAWIVSARS